MREKMILAEQLLARSEIEIMTACSMLTEKLHIDFIQYI
jgi:hypothetical protein